MNYGYEALCDLATALNTDKQSITFDGKLSIAFGARGRGNAMAHYEPMREVINLTKMNGAGSLAHEWCHALDDAFRKTLYPTNTSKIGKHPAMLSDLSRMYKPMDELMKTLKYTSQTVEEAVKTYQGKLDQKLNGMGSWFKYCDTMLADDLPEQSRKEYEQLKKKVIESAEHDKLKAYEWDLCDAYKNFADFVKANKKASARYETIPHNSVGYQIPIWMNSISLASAMLEQAKEGTLHSTVNTKFYADAKQLDIQFSEDAFGYWSSDVELFARAGACYIKDKLAEKGITDNYLCGHADQRGIEQKDGTVIYSQPIGADRKRIDDAFDTFFSEANEKLSLVLGKKNEEENNEDEEEEEHRHR